MVHCRLPTPRDNLLSIQSVTTTAKTSHRLKHNQKTQEVRPDAWKVIDALPRLMDVIGAAIRGQYGRCYGAWIRDVYRIRLSELTCYMVFIIEMRLLQLCSLLFMHHQVVR